VILLKFDSTAKKSPGCDIAQRPESAALISIMLASIVYICMAIICMAPVKAQEGQGIALWFGSEQDESDWIQFQFPDDFPNTAPLTRDLLATRG